MKAVVAVLIGCVSLCACGGGGGETGPAQSGYQTVLGQFGSLYENAAGLDFTDLSRAPQTGQYQYHGHAALDVIGPRSAITRDQMYLLFDGMKVDDVIAHPDLIAQMTLTADFSRDVATARLHGFRTANDTVRAGEITMADGVIDDGYFHFSGTLGGSIADSRVTQTATGFMFGDFAGTNATMAGGGLGFVAGGNGYAGVFVTRR